MSIIIFIIIIIIITIIIIIITIIIINNFWNFRLGQISHVFNVTLYSWGQRGWGGVRKNNVYCFLLRMANLLIFIHNGGI